MGDSRHDGWLSLIATPTVTYGKLCKRILFWGGGKEGGGWGQKKKRFISCLLRSQWDSVLAAATCAKKQQACRHLLL